jgi:hypothetical protein
MHSMHSIHSTMHSTVHLLRRSRLNRFSMPAPLNLCPLNRLCIRMHASSISACGWGRSTGVQEHEYRSVYEYRSVGEYRSI